MINKIQKWVGENEKMFIALLIVIALSIRLFGVNQPLHQDEYKWPVIANPATATNDIPHPPLSQFIFRMAGYIVGFNVHFRYIPLFFFSIDLVLFYYVLKNRLGKREAAIGSVLFVLSYFSILASLMVDTDGTILPFFFLLMLFAYDKAKDPNNKNRVKWLLSCILFAFLGTFVKLSFVIAIGAILADFLWQKRNYLNAKLILKYVGYLAAFFAVFIAILLISPKIFPFFHLDFSLTYWETFVRGNRNWFQTGIQCVKAILYSSPFLILVPFFVPKNKLKDVLPFIFYLLFGLIFYIIIFDFSIGALDRYFQFFVIPLCALCAVAINEVMQGDSSRRNKEFLYAGIIIAAILTYLATVPHFIPSLHPKADWIGRILSVKWNFVYPFSGGSGPMGFYVSFLFMGVAWVISLLLVVYGFFKTSARKKALLLLIPIGLAYNFMFTGEYLFGFLNGYAPKLITNVAEFIKNDPSISMVTVYNDNGGNEIRETGKYRKRLYTSPEFDLSEKIANLNKYKEHYLEIDIPHIDPNSVYRKYLDSCKIVYSETDKKISAIVYDCKNAPDIKSE